MARLSTSFIAKTRQNLGDKFLKLKIITGSNRTESNSGKIAQIIAQRVQDGGSFSDVNEINFAKVNIPQWDEAVWQQSPPSPQWQPIKDDIIKPMQQDDAFVIITPEYAGMVPGILKNFFLLCGTKEMGHKPALIVSVSSGIGGSYPVAELRMSSYKNNRLCYIPDHIIVRNADEFDGSSSTSARLDYCLSLLSEYSKALKHVRDSGVINTKDFPFGL